MSDRIVAEALAAVGAADVVVFLFDGRAGLSDADTEALALVRDTGCPLLIAVNKIDQPGQENRCKRVLRDRRGRPDVHFRGALARSGRVAGPCDRADACARRYARRGWPRSQSRAGWPAQRRQVVAAQSPVGFRARNRGRHSRHHAGSGRCAVVVARTRRAADRHGWHPAADAGRGRTRAALGGPCNRDHPTHRRGTAGGRRD